jgi:hypothetical protein
MPIPQRRDHVADVFLGRPALFAVPPFIVVEQDRVARLGE